MDGSEARLAPGLAAGWLEGISLPDLIWALSRAQQTGVLKVRRENITKTLYVQEGRIVFAASSDPNDRLGEMLLRRGTVTIEQLEEGLTRLDTGKRLGTLLVEAGSLTAEQLVDAVLDQVKSVVLDLLTWERGEYDFVQGRLPTHEAITLQMKTSELLLEAIRNIHSFSRIRLSVGPPRHVFRLAQDWVEAREELSFSEGERLLLGSLAKGPSSVEVLCREVFLSNFEIYRTLWAFKVLGVVVEGDTCPAESDAPVEGKLERTSLAELLLSISSKGETGVLCLSRGSVDRGIHFHEGRCVFATSNHPDDGLMAYLFRRGVISLRDQEEAARRLLTNKRIGTILRETGAIDDADLAEMVREQVSEIIYDSFGWPTGEYVFLVGSLPSVEEITLNLEVAALVSEGTRRVTSWTRVIRGCGGVDQPLRLSPSYLGILDEMGAGPDEWEIANALKTPQSARRVCAQSELPDFRATQILWIMKLLGAVEPAPEDDIEVPLELPPRDAVEPQPAQMTVAPEAPSIEAAQAPSPVAEVPSIARHEVEAALRMMPIHGHLPTGGEREPVDADQPAPSEAITETSAFDDTPDGTEPRAAEAVSEPFELVEPEEEDEPEPDWDPPGNLDEIIQRFNAMHRVVYRAVRTEIGAGAVNFVRSCCCKVSDDGNDVLEDVQLCADGSWDADGLRKSVVKRRIEDPWPTYQRLLDREFMQLQPHLGDTRAQRLKEQIWELNQSLG